MKSTRSMGFLDSQPTFMIFEKPFRFGIGIGVLLKRYNNAPVKAGVKLRGKNLRRQRNVKWPRPRRENFIHLSTLKGQM